MSWAPGPWRTGDLTTDFWIYDAEGNAIGVVFAYGPAMDRAATARLMAAAWGLRQAAQGLVEALSERLGPDGTPGSYAGGDPLLTSEEVQALQLARAALAQAEGREAVTP